MFTPATNGLGQTMLDFENTRRALVNYAALQMLSWDDVIGDADNIHYSCIAVLFFTFN